MFRVISRQKCQLIMPSALTCRIVYNSSSSLSPVNSAFSSATAPSSSGLTRSIWDEIRTMDNKLSNNNRKQQKSWTTSDVSTKRTSNTNNLSSKPRKKSLGKKKRGYKSTDQNSPFGSGVVPSMRSSSSTSSGSRSSSTGDFNPASLFTGQSELDWKKLSGKNFELQNLEPPYKVEVNRLAHGLDRVLFNPGVHYLQDPRSGVFNFDPYLQRIVQPEYIDFDTFTPYIIASKDKLLHEMANKHDCKFVSSTSSMTSVLSQMYFLISAGKPIDMRRLSSEFIHESARYTRMSRMPTSVVLQHKNGVYSVSADKSLDKEETVLSRLGKSMEKMLTLNRQDFSRHLQTQSSSLSDHQLLPESYHYAKAGGFLLRAQLDCQDPRLPHKTFDLKTRASLAVRLDASNYMEQIGYHIRRSLGMFESFEREYYDMMRAAFLKYSLQVRIGQMDGIFVAFHNTARIFGFQYISLDEMDAGLFGSSAMGKESFGISIRLLEEILHSIIKQHPGKTVRVTFDTDDQNGVCNVYGEELTQNSNVDRNNVFELNPSPPTSARSDEIPEDGSELQTSLGTPEIPRQSHFRVSAYSSLNDKNIDTSTSSSSGNNPRLSDFPRVSDSGHDRWIVNYSIEDLTPTNQDDIVSLQYEYYRIRKAQDLINKRVRDTSNPLMDKIRKHYLTKDEELRLEEQWKNHGEKILYMAPDRQELPAVSSEGKLIPDPVLEVFEVAYRTAPPLIITE